MAFISEEKAQRLSRALIQAAARPGRSCAATAFQTPASRLASKCCVDHLNSHRFTDKWLSLSATICMWLEDLTLRMQQRHHLKAIMYGGLIGSLTAVASVGYLLRRPSFPMYPLWATARLGLLSRLSSEPTCIYSNAPPHQIHHAFVVRLVRRVSEHSPLCGDLRGDCRGLGIEKANQFDSLTTYLTLQTQHLKRNRT
jgi:hypothetical protein